MNNQNMKTGAAALSVISNTTLVVLKLVVGLAIGSVSVLSEAIHSGVDLVAAGIALFAVRKSAQPADRSHPYGHGKVENAAGTIEALLIFFAAGWIIYEATLKLIHPEPMEEVSWGILVMGVSAFANLIVSRILFRVGEKTDSIALKADGMHLRTDVYTSAGVMAGLLIYWLAGFFFTGTSIWWIDPVAAIIVALLIIKAAFELTIESAKDLFDARLPEHEEDIIREEVLSLYPSAYGYHHLKTRKSGADRFFDFHLVVPQELSIKEAHDISDELKLNVAEKLPQAAVEIHLEPCDLSCKDHCRMNCFYSG
ncbi:MAG: cation transporter [bacterium]|nr:cation transporter [bacterium]